MKTKWRDKGEKRGEGRNKNKFEQRKRRESCSHRAREITNEIETRRCGKRIKIKRGCIPGAKSPLGLRNGKPGLDLSTPRHISSNPKIREGRRNNDRLFSVFSRFPNPLSREKGRERSRSLSLSSLSSSLSHSCTYFSNKFVRTSQRQSVLFK